MNDPEYIWDGFMNLENKQSVTDRTAFYQLCYFQNGSAVKTFATHVHIGKGGDHRNEQK